jgi:hypothetical protein
LKEPIMDHAEEQVRRLFALATGDLPPDIELLRGVQVRRVRRRRASAALATVGAAVAAVVLVTMLPGTAAVTPSRHRAPSALTLVLTAATRTAASSYHFTAAVTDTQTPADGQQPQRITSAGAVDPARGVGEVSASDGEQVRMVGGYLYVGGARGPAGKPFDGKPWFRVPVHSVRIGLGGTPDLKAVLVTDAQGFSQTSPQGLLTLLKSAGRIRAAGPASGPGWTGVHYVFSGTMRRAYADLTTPFTGAVDVDQQGRVRQLAVTFTRRLPPGDSPKRLTTRVAVSYGAFGATVSVSSPPPDQTATLVGTLLVGGG